MESAVTYRHIQRKNKNKSLPVSLTYKIFIVEDNHSSQMFLESYLSKMPNCPHDKKPNLDIYSFNSGEDCLTAMNLNPDIVILDFYLNESNSKAANGLYVLKQIKQKRPSTKVIIMSGQENVMVTAELYNKGASDYISKEHYGVVRVGQSILRLISEIEEEKKKRSRRLFWGLLLLIFGMLIGLSI